MELVDELWGGVVYLRTANRSAGGRYHQPSAAHTGTSLPSNGYEDGSAERDGEEVATPEEQQRDPRETRVALERLGGEDLGRVQNQKKYK
jgi:hypothetical protein